MHIHSADWLPILTLVLIATVVDVWSRRVPNWLVIPFLTSGVVVTTVNSGMQGLERSLSGIALAVAVTGVFCWLRGMGMGDLKLCAAVGAWVGPSQMGTALVATGLAGGVMALIWATCHRSLGDSLDASSDLIAGFWKTGIRPHPELVLDSPGARTMPYAPAIAIGTILSFFSS